MKCMTRTKSTMKENPTTEGISYHIAGNGKSWSYKYGKLHLGCYNKLVKKTSYELLTGKKPNVSYFRVFGARCWIKDPHHTSKFAPKAHEGFMLGYGKDSHSYRVFNLFHYKVVETVDLQFDETKGSQREHLPNVLDEATPSKSIKLMGTREI